MLAKQWWSLNCAIKFLSAEDTLHVKDHYKLLNLPHHATGLFPTQSQNRRRPSCARSASTVTYRCARSRLMSCRSSDGRRGAAAPSRRHSRPSASAQDDASSAARRTDGPKRSGQMGSSLTPQKTPGARRPPKQSLTTCTAASRRSRRRWRGWPSAGSVPPPGPSARGPTGRGPGPQPACWPWRRRRRLGVASRFPPHDR